ncbi:hypothetical protein JTB14_027749 [Gonioctena quinquepunctata]|nr:hypothetical protein JTB14_027749 [Gonioctena quinquepunctata]
MKLKSIKCNFQKTNKSCDFCNRRGHIQDECWFLNKNEGYPKKKKTWPQRNNSTHKVKKIVNNNDEEKHETENEEEHGDEYEGGTSNDEYHVCFMMTPSSRYQWYVDSTATCHMVCDKNFFDYLDENICETIYLADGTKLKSEGVGYGYINIEAENGHSYKYKVKDDLYVIDCYLLSVRKLTEKTLTVNFKNDICTIENGSVLIAKAYLKGNLYKLKTVNRIMLTKQSTVKCDINLLHRRLGHRDIPVSIYWKRTNS